MSNDSTRTIAMAGRFPPEPASNGVDLRRAGDVNPLIFVANPANEGTHIPRSPLGFLKSTPLKPGSVSSGNVISTQDSRECNHWTSEKCLRKSIVALGSIGGVSMTRKYFESCFSLRSKYETGILNNVKAVGPSK